MLRVGTDGERRETMEELAAPVGMMLVSKRSHSGSYARLSRVNFYSRSTDWL
ncbi:hypothetical protein ACQEVG_37450 [Streptomyces sp. CA-135486]|uniref:hypothetical protein n=1 Tax=Streptomyces sp. CA-135486 TaxID=3240049 RepID=UPI003D908A0D